MNNKVMHAQATMMLTDAAREGRLYPFIVPYGLESPGGRIFDRHGFQCFSKAPQLLERGGQAYIISLDHTLEIPSDEAEDVLNEAGFRSDTPFTLADLGMDADDLLVAYCNVRIATRAEYQTSWHYISYQVGKLMYTDRHRQSYANVIRFGDRLRAHGWGGSSTTYHLNLFDYEVREAPNEPEGIVYYDTMFQRGGQLIRLHGHMRFPGKAQALFANALAWGPTSDPWHELTQNGYYITSQMPSDGLAVAVQKDRDEAFYLVYRG